MTKLCRKCNKPKSLETEFSRRSDAKDGRDIYCKLCKSGMTKSWNDQNPDKLKICKQKSDKTWYRNNKQRKMDINAEWKENNSAHVKKWYRNYKKEREVIDPAFKIANKIRNRLWYALKGKKRTCRFDECLGCTREFLVKYLESKFEPGMTWDNYGKWEIDHIEPLFKFNLIEKEELLSACNYINLQPLWKDDHKKKTKKDLRRHGSKK